MKTRISSSGVCPEPVTKSRYDFWTSQSAHAALHFPIFNTELVTFSSEGTVTFAHKPFFFSLLKQVPSTVVELCGEDRLKPSCRKPAFLTPAVVSQMLWVDVDWKTGSCHPGIVFLELVRRPGLPGERIWISSSCRREREGGTEVLSPGTGLWFSAHGDWEVAKITSVRP